MEATFKKYKDLEREFDFRIDGLSVSKSLTFPLYKIAKGSANNFKFYKILNIFRAFDLSNLKFETNSHFVLSSGGLINRKDYKEIYDFVLSQCEGKVSYCLLYNLKRKVVFHPIMLIELGMSIWKYFKSEKISLSSLIGFYSSAAMLCNSAIELKKLNLRGIKKYLAFENAIGYENLITQFMKLRGIETYSLAEGMYMWFPECDCIDAVQHENIETDHLICWGQYSVDEFVKAGISGDRLLVGGYPHPVKGLPMKKNNQYKKCVVLLTRKSFEKSNQRLLNILSKKEGVQFCLKLHPSLSLSEYEKYAIQNGMKIIPKEMTINDCLDNDKFDFAIAVNTTAYYEALMRGVPCLRFSDGSYKLMKGYDDIFCNSEDYEIVLEKIKEASISQYQENVNEMLKYTVGYGINNYKKILLDG